MILDWNRPNSMGLSTFSTFFCFFTFKKKRLTYKTLDPAKEGEAELSCYQFTFSFFVALEDFQGLKKYK